MKQVKKPTKGPPKLVALLGEFADAINGITLISGKGISITTTADGWIINAEDSSHQGTASSGAAPAPPASSGGGGSGADTKTPDGDAGWVKVNIVVQTTGGYSTLPYWFWGGQANA